MSLDHFFKNLTEIPEVFIGTTVIFILLILYTRLFGLKSFSKMTGFDFVITVAIGNIIAMTVNTGSPSVLVGAVLLLILYALNYLINYIRFKSQSVEKLIENKPIMLMRNGEILKENMKRSKVTESELQSKLREANVINLSQVKAVILESTGDVLVLHTDKENIDVDDYLLQGIEI
ncbi:DUF421 domain-containing protein [Marixanthomonas spongiae]|uniref:DUF421 domain-containing protein n=1 Tax=Marixanthomonas spongiae TaxID=2174845 RepID=A0A2U0HXD6_9FLAO|nr:YetF domain-containing protein [Marixanthomonas spongiae]PVW13496.1 DUF421 domain-containing protein [Marixanthomonas spongiae]